VIAGETLRIERTYEAPAEAVFDAWTSEEVLRRWWRAERDWETPEAQVEVWVGGAIRIVMRGADGAAHGARGTYTEVDRPRRLVFTWTWDSSERETLIEIEFAETAGATTVTFTHSGLADEESVRSHEYGWSNILAELGRYLEDGG
jgi:uncharacterized protein YndB with AHSA1/START domain